MNIVQKISNWYFSGKALPYWGLLILDCCIVAFSGYVGYYFDLGGDGFAANFWPMTAANLLALVPFAISFKLFHTYSGIVRYSSFIDLQRVATAAFTGSVAFYLIGYVTGSVFPNQTIFYFPKLNTAVTVFILSTLLLWVERILVKRLFDSFHLDGALPVAIYGTKAGGISIAKSIVSIKDKKYSLHAFVSDGPEMKGAYIMGKPVYQNGAKIAEKLRDEGVKALLVSPLKTERFRQNQEMVDDFLNAGLKILMMTNAEEWDGKDISLTHN